MSSAFEALTSTSRRYQSSLRRESDSDFIYLRIFERPGVVITGSRNGSDPFGSYRSQEARGTGRSKDARLFKENLGLRRTRRIDFCVVILEVVAQKQQEVVENLCFFVFVSVPQESN